MVKQKLIPGTIWITGLSASGKSTLGGKLFNDLKAIGVNNVKLLDGETIRKEFGDTFGYVTNERNAILEKTIQMVRECNDNGNNAIVSTISHKRAKRQEIINRGYSVDLVQRAGAGQVCIYMLKETY